jgi:hypothetical protein
MPFLRAFAPVLIAMSYTILATYALYASIAAAIVCSAIANAHLHPEKKELYRVFFWRARSDFSEKGWKFRQASACLGAVAVALIPLSKMIQFLEAH